MDSTTSTKPPKYVLFARRPRTSTSLFELKSKGLPHHSNLFSMISVVLSPYRLREANNTLFSLSMTTCNGQQFTYSLTRRKRPALQPINTNNPSLTRAATISNVSDAMMAGEDMIMSSSEGYCEHVAQHLRSVLRMTIVRMELRSE